MKSNIILTGMPGAGKSTVGVILAKHMGLDFVDVDILIAKRQGMKLQDILDQRGVDYFLEAEETEGVLLDCTWSVISTGGSMVMSEHAMKHLKGIGTNVYLNVPVKVLEDRLINIKTRGVVARPGQSVYDIYKARSPLYRKYADIEIDCKGKSTEEIVEEIAGSTGTALGK